MTDFSTPQRMSANAFIIILVKNFNKLAGIFFLYVFIGIFESSDGIFSGELILKTVVTIATLLAIVLLTACASYFPKKFYVKDRSLIFTHGLLHRETTTIPLDKIHTLRTQRGIAYRLLDMRGISFDTLASKKEEIELILDETDWVSLINLIEKEEGNQINEQDNTNTDTVNQTSNSYRFGNRNLILAALCQNHLKGMAVLGGFLAVIYNRVSEISDSAVETVLNQSEEYLETMIISPIIIASVLGVLYVISLILWIGKVLFKYYNTGLNWSSNLLTFSYGLLSRSSCRFALNKICTIYVKRNLMEKRYGFATIMLRQALFASAAKEQDNLKLYGRDDSVSYLRWWLGEDYANSPDLITAKSGLGAALHVIVPAMVVSLVVTIVLGYYYLYFWISIPVLYLTIKIIQGVSKMRRSKIILKKDYLTVDNGCFADIHNYLKYGNIEVVRIIKSPFTPLSHRVSIVISTPGTTFKIRSITQSDANIISNHLLSKSIESM